MADPKIIAPEMGIHNAQLSRSMERLSKGAIYKDASVVCIVPTRGMVHARVIQSWFQLMSPMNHKFVRLFMVGMEVGAAYSAAIETILSNGELSRWKYILTLEEDNMPPPDGLLKLIESLSDSSYSAIGGLYWTKGPEGQPMIYGNPNEMPKDFRPQVPQPESVQECNGLGMGFTLFKTEMFKDMRIPTPPFRTVQEYTPQGTQVFTQDLWFFQNAGTLGHRFACDTRVKVGHYDADNDIVW